MHDVKGLGFRLRPFTVAKVNVEAKVSPATHTLSTGVPTLECEWLRERSMGQALFTATMCNTQAAMGAHKHILRHQVDAFSWAAWGTALPVFPCWPC